jgi:hypothetical protein
MDTESFPLVAVAGPQAECRRVLFQGNSGAPVGRRVCSWSAFKVREHSWGTGC